MTRRSLSKARILRAALTVADREGLEALTMRKVAAKLDVDPMALYHHLPNKNAMLDGMLDLLITRAKLPTGDLSPEEWIRGMADAVRSIARTHPRTFALLAHRPIPMLDPLAAQPVESGLAAFRAAGFSAAEAFHIIQTVGLTLVAFGMYEATALLGEDADTGSQVAALPIEQFPHIAEVAGLPEAEADRIWDVGVNGLVHGLLPRT